MRRLGGQLDLPAAEKNAVGPAGLRAGPRPVLGERIQRGLRCGWPRTFGGTRGGYFFGVMLLLWGLLSLGRQTAPG